MQEGKTLDDINIPLDCQYKPLHAQWLVELSNEMTSQN